MRYFWIWLLRLFVDLQFIEPNNWNCYLIGKSLSEKENTPAKMLTIFGLSCTDKGVCSWTDIAPIRTGRAHVPRASRWQMLAHFPHPRDAAKFYLVSGRLPGHAAVLDCDASRQLKWPIWELATTANMGWTGGLGWVWLGWLGANELGVCVFLI